MSIRRRHLIALLATAGWLIPTGARAGAVPAGVGVPADPAQPQDIVVTGQRAVTEASGGTKSDTPLIETPRLRLTHLSAADAPFTQRLLNEPDFIRNIGDRGVRDLDGALDYLNSRVIAGYQRNGYGMYRVGLKTTGEAVGMCGLVKRDTLEHPDIGFAFLEQFRRQGYAREAAVAVRDHARDVLGLTQLLAVTTPDNYDSLRVLLALGFLSEDLVRLGDDPAELRLLRWRA